MSAEHAPGIAILASGSGSTAEAFIRATQEGKVNAEVGLVVCNNPPERAGIYGRIDRLNQEYGLDIPVHQINNRTHPEGAEGNALTLAASEAIAELIRREGCAHVALMGYMKVMRGALIDEFAWRPTHSSIYQARMSNTHPGSLPETAGTFGIHASELILQRGLPYTDHTVHLVSLDVDGGPVLARHRVEVREGETAETLFSRVQVVEKLKLPGVIDLFLKKQGEYNAHS